MHSSFQLESVQGEHKTTDNSIKARVSNFFITYNPPKSTDDCLSINGLLQSLNSFFEIPEINESWKEWWTGQAEI